jgi:hypothetical protein
MIALFSMPLVLRIVGPTLNFSFLLLMLLCLALHYLSSVLGGEGIKTIHFTRSSDKHCCRGGKRFNSNYGEFQFTYLIFLSMYKLKNK